MVDLPAGYDQLSKEDLENLFDRLKEKKVIFGKCELCGNSDWKVFPSVLSPKILIRNVETKALKEWSDKSFNSVVFSCSNCGNSKYLELHYLGIAFSLPEVKKNG